MKATPAQTRNLKWLIWVYFWLLIFEGALRKWIVPQLSVPLLIIRDPVVILIYAQAWVCGLFPKNKWVAWTMVLAVLCFLASLTGIGTMKVTLYGLRTDFLHLPLIFLLPCVFDYEDSRSVGKWILLLSAPMAALVFLQFISSPEAWINAAAGGESGQMSAALGRIRPPGLFSFITGMVSYTTLVAAYLAHHFVDRKVYQSVLIYISMVALMVSVVFSGSRSSVASVAIVVGMVVFIAIKRGVMSLAYLKYVALFILIYFALGHLPMFREGLAVHEERFEEGGGIHEGLIDRFFTELATSFDASYTAPFFGLGLGIGTNAGAGLLTGTRQFLVSEGEWGRVIIESGPVLGFAYIALRFGILFNLLSASFASFRRGNSLPLLLVSATGLDLVTGQFGQPTELGFVVFTSGLCLVATPRGEDAPQAGEPARKGKKKIPGRSAYAEALHGGKTGNAP